MRRLRSLLLLGGTALGITLISAAATTTSAVKPDEAHIRRVLQAYFDGRARGDTALLGSAFLLPQATMYAWRDTTLLELPIPQWLVRIANNQRMVPRDPAERDEVIAIDIDHTVAHAKVRTTTPRLVITDHMNLVKVNGRWVIVSKVFESVPR